MLAAILAAASIVAPAPVTALAADGPRVAFAAGCEVRMWAAPRPVSIRLARHSCPQTSTGSGIGAVAVAGPRALWLHYAGGNVREWSLWTATPTSRPRRLRFVAGDVDRPAPIVVGRGDHGRLGSLLPYAVDSDVIVLRANGSRAFAWRSPARVVALDANGGEVAAALDDRRVFVLDGRGRVLREEQFLFPIESVHITGNALLVRGVAFLEVRGSGEPRRYEIPRRARWLDAVGTRVLYVIDRRVHILRLDSRVNVRAARGVAAAIEPTGVFVADGRRISFSRAR